MFKTENENVFIQSEELANAILDGNVDLFMEQETAASVLFYNCLCKEV